MFSFFLIFSFSFEYEIFYDSMYTTRKVLPVDPTKYFPICNATSISKENLKMGEIISGEKLGKLGGKIDSESNNAVTYTCEKTFNSKEVEKLQEIILSEYRAGFSVADLPVASHTVGQFRYQNVPIGYKDGPDFLVRNKFVFQVASRTVNKKNEILMFDSATFQNSYTLLKENETIKFSYSISNVKPLEKHSRANRDPEFSVMNKSMKAYFVISVVIALFCVSSAVVIYVQNRSKDTDGAASTRGLDLEFDDTSNLDEIGWRLLHGDVFRSPQHNILFSSLVGVGIEFALTLLIVFVLAFFGVFDIVSFPTFVEPFVLIYFFTAPLNGFFATKIFKTIGRQFWKKNLALSGTAASMFLFVSYVLLQVGFTSGDSSAKVTIKYLIKTSFVIFGGSFFFHVIGSVPALKSAAFTVPTAVNQLPRHIPQQPFSSSMLFSCVTGGFAVFVIISLVLHMILESLWTGFSFFDTFGRATVSFGCAILVSAGVSIIAVYTMLSSEDYRWWWRSFLVPASAGIYACLYAIIFAIRTCKPALGDLVPYIIESLLIGAVLFVSCGCAGFFGSFIFVLSLYDSLKME